MNAAVETEVAVVGAGPAGLAAAIALRASGVEHVTVLEREGEGGGATRHCGHPPFGLHEFGRVLTGPAYARRLQTRALAAGVDLRLRHSVVSLQPCGVLSLATPNGALEIRARRVLLATGARETPRSARLISGQRPLGVINTGALQSYIYLQRLKPFLHPVVVGSELVGVSALWTCISHGVRPVAVVEEGDRPTAPWPLGLFPRLLGTPVHYRSRLVDIVGASRVEAVVVENDLGARNRIDCDGVLFTGGFTPETALMHAGGLAVDPAGGGARVDQFGRCSDTGYFAAGNVLRGIETAAWCWREGCRAARVIADDLGGRLAPARSVVPILPGRGVRLVSPQAIAFPLSARSADPIQVRASESLAGALVVRADGRALWSQKVRLKPERRVLIAPVWIPQAQGCAEIRIAME